MKEEYITTQISKADLAEKYGVRRETLSKRASKEGWDEARSQYGHAVTSKVLKKVSSQEAEIRARQIGVARTMRGIAQAALKELSDENRLSSLLKADATELRLWLKDSAEIERRAAGIPDAVEDLTPDDIGRMTEEELRELAYGPQTGKGSGGS